jgi:hypothetical protein
MFSVADKGRIIRVPESIKPRNAVKRKATLPGVNCKWVRPHSLAFGSVVPNFRRLSVLFTLR